MAVVKQFENVVTQRRGKQSSIPVAKAYITGGLYNFTCDKDHTTECGKYGKMWKASRERTNQVETKIMRDMDLYRRWQREEKNNAGRTGGKERKIYVGKKAIGKKKQNGK